MRGRLRTAFKLRKALTCQPASEFARQVPGFGGFFLDRSGNPTLYLTRGSSRAPAERLLAGYLRGRGLTTAAIRVLEGRYGWHQLERWQAQASTEALAVTGAVFVDNDETSNRVLIGVENLSASGQVRAALARLRIPDEAVIVERADPIVQVATLQNVVDRPVRAGVQINFPGFLCSVGFNATSGTQKSFVTASHCTTTQGGVESTPYWQPLQSSQPTQIATEVADPVYKKNIAGCPRNKLCRYSDASRAAYINGANQALGLIAQTSGANNGSLEITGCFTITADDCSTRGGCLAVGDHGEQGRPHHRLDRRRNHQHLRQYRGPGHPYRPALPDLRVSGSGRRGQRLGCLPDHSGSSVKLAGILWGGNSGGTQFVFSPLGNVISELGPLITH